MNLVYGRSIAPHLQSFSLSTQDAFDITDPGSMQDLQLCVTYEPSKHDHESLHSSEVTASDLGNSGSEGGI